ncbi:MAG: iron chelate uptake ABC transporter family permease subunit, partial [Bacteroidales bacterium]
MKKLSFLFFLMLIGFLLDLSLGSVLLPLNDIIATIAGKAPNEVIHEIILNYRLPKAVTAILSGAALSVGGVLMQTLFRNPLAGPDVLGVNSGAGLGVALFT